MEVKEASNYNENIIQLNDGVVKYLSRNIWPFEFLKIHKVGIGKSLLKC